MIEESLAFSSRLTSPLIAVRLRLHRTIRAQQHHHTERSTRGNGLVVLVTTRRILPGTYVSRSCWSCCVFSTMIGVCSISHPVSFNEKSISFAFIFPFVLHQILLLRCVLFMQRQYEYSNGTTRSPLPSPFDSSSSSNLPALFLFFLSQVLSLSYSAQALPSLPYLYPPCFQACKAFLNRETNHADTYRLPHLPILS